MWFYIPWLQIKSGTLAFFTATNPGIDTGGIGLESKFESMKNLPPELCPKTILFKKNDALNELYSRLQEEQITFPLIAKPDLGYRGLLVKKINSLPELKQFLSTYPLDFLIQELVTGMEEFGVFYIRYPQDKKGKVVSLTLKEFLHVTGDGQSTVEELVSNKPRALLQLPALQKTKHMLLKKIPKKGELVPLGVIGNHSKGTMFVNGRHLIDQQLSDTFDQISKRIDGFYYGRYDIKCTSLEDLKEGKNIVIIELNGTCSEPTHIYDSGKMSYWEVIHEIRKYWKEVYRISKQNRRLGVKCQSQREIAQRFIDLRKYFIEIEKIKKKHPEL